MRVGRRSDNFFDTKIDWWERALSGPLVEIPARVETTDTLGWLLSTVLPLLEREVVSEMARGENRLITELARIVEIGRDNRRQWRHMTVKPPKYVVG